MNTHTFLGVFAAVAILVPIATIPAHALSCLPTDMYLKDIVGKEEKVTVLVGTVTDQIEETDYTAEVLKVTEVKQGYAEEEVIAYHEKSVDWGYLCNAGPTEEGDEGLYIMLRDGFGKYQVTQRLALTDPLVDTLEEDLKKAEIEGFIAESTRTDRINQIITIITDSFREIQILFKEYFYWMNVQ